MRARSRQFDALAPDVIVGRAHELRVLQDCLDHAVHTGPAVVHLVGPAGLGKTRLIAYTCAEARRRGMAVFQGTADERDRARPFAAACDPFEAYLRSGSKVWRRRLPGADDLLRRGLRSRHPPLNGSSPLGARGMGSMLRGLLASLAESRPVVLAFDDVHWADEGSLDILASLSGRPPQVPVVVLVGYRPVPGLESLRAVRTGSVEGQARGVMQRLELAPLEPTEVAQLLPDAGPAQIRSLLKSCGGNPFYLQAMYRSPASGNAEPDGVDSLPYAVRAALASELRAVNPSARAVADTAAVLGDPFDPGLLAAVAGVSPTQALEHLDELRRHDIATSDPVGRWRFRHPLLRWVCYEEQPVGLRLATHRRAAEELAQRGAHPPELARHVMISGERGDRRAAELLTAAADQLAPQAPNQAVRCYDAALRLVPDGGGRDLSSVQLARAEALAATGSLDAAREAGHELLGRLPVEDDRRTAATRLVARIEHLMGRNAESAAMLLRELNQADRSGNGVATLYLELATTRLMGGSFLDARAAAIAARELVADDDQVLCSYAAAVVALCSAVGDDPESALLDRALAADLLDSLADAELARALEAGVWLGWAEMFLERLPAARRHLERCLAIARRGAHQPVLPHLLVGYGSVLTTMGELGPAAEVFDEAAEAADRLASTASSAMTLTMQCRVATWLGRFDRAEKLGVEAVKSALGTGDWFAAVAVATLAQARLAAGRSSGCATAIVNAGGGRDLHGFDPGSRCDWWEVAVRAALQEGDEAAAADFSSRAAECSARLGLSAPKGFAALAEAQRFLHHGAFVDAAQCANAAAAHFSASGHRLDAARAQLCRGEALSAAGHRSEALESLTSAEAEFGHCDAFHLRSLARADMRRLGKRLPRTPPQTRGVRAEAAGPLGVLTDREREVATLVAAGHTNRQIASSLVVSEKTVESHLGHIFTKLEVRSRAAVAGLAARR